jgi:P-type Ca2+ transporter type 2C
MERTDPRTGLSDAEAAARLRTGGPNELPSADRRTPLRIAADVLREPMFLILLACGAIYLFLGDHQEALILLGFVIIVAVITLYQEQKTERALAALRDLSSPRAQVLREAKRRRIPGREVVWGDLLVLAEGDRVPADAALVECHHLSADESLLTGESAPVRKMAWDGAPPLGRPGGDDLPFVYAGTLVTRGHGVAEVQAVGLQTEMGRIGRALQIAAPEPSALQRETGRLVARVAVVAVALCAVVVAAYGLTRAWLTGLLAGLTLAMAILPNEFPAVLTIFLALGAWRIARVRALARRLPVVESLGAATVLCVDKTGTLTLNQMAVARLVAEGRMFDVPGDPSAPLPEFVHQLVEYAILASQRDPFDPMERAFHALGERRLAGTEHLHPNWQLIREYPLSPRLLALSHVWRSPDGTDLVIAAKGAYEAVADLCHLPPEELERLAAQARLLAADGLRVLGVARARFRAGRLPEDQHDFDFELIGLAGLADPIRPGVPEALAQCRSAGIRVVMITGDHPRTAASIARQIGLPSPDQVLDGRDLHHLSEPELIQRLDTVNVFARVVPDQKLRLVQAFQTRGEVVAMTGDGVNDAPALKAADIGIAMGGRGTDVAREASSLVLVDDDFSTIVTAVRLGRRVFANLSRAMAYILAIHVPIAGITVAPVLLGLPLVLMPVHVAFLHLIIEPACSVVFEAEPDDPELMRRPPRDPRAPLFGRALIGGSLLQGAAVLLILLALFVVVLRRGTGELEARAITFTALVVANLGLILGVGPGPALRQRLRSRNVALWLVIGGGVVFLALVLYLPILRTLFRFSLLHPDDLAVSAGAGLLGIGLFQLLRLGRRAIARTGADHPARGQA